MYQSTFRFFLSTPIYRADTSKVQPGQKVKLKISSCPYPDYGTASGRVESISPDVMTLSSEQNESKKSNTFSQNSASYKVIINLETSVLEKRKNEQCAIRSGMEGEAGIIIKKETVLRFILRKARLLVGV